MLGFRKKIIPVQTYGAPVLKTLAAPVKAITPEILELAEKMVETMFAFDGIGLAAPQVGIGLRMITLGLPNQLPKDYDPSPGEALLLPMMPLAMINPIILSFGDIKTIHEEGCLSVPEIYASVERPRDIMLQAEIINHGLITIACGGLLSRCLQHELDHLNGKLFIDRLTSEELQNVKEELEVLFDAGQKNNFQRNKR